MKYSGQKAVIAVTAETSATGKRGRGPNDRAAAVGHDELRSGSRKHKDPAIGDRDLDVTADGDHARTDDDTESIETSGRQDATGLGQGKRTDDEESENEVSESAEFRGEISFALSSVAGKTEVCTDVHEKSGIETTKAAAQAVAHNRL